MLPRFSIALLLLSFCLPGIATAAPDEKPNILFISMDDLNDWIGCLGGHPQAITPNLDRLAASGALFNNAHCPAPACNPSRSAIFTGISPHVSGLYENGQKMREVMPDATLMPKYFSENGYWSAGSGKLLHYFIDATSWDDYFPKAETERPLPRTLYPENRPVSLPVGGPWQYVETDWAALDATDEEFGGDWLVSQWIGEQLSKEHGKPFFLACGIYRPHEPWFVPKKYFEPFPLESIQLPPGYKADDLDDLPSAGKKRGPNRYFEHIQKNDQWKQGIQGYLASIYFADTMLGRVLDSLESGPNKDNTIVVLWSDHGWHLGEKQHWQKYTAWRAVTRVPLMIRVPNLTKPGTICEQPVNLICLFPTLTELAGLPKNPVAKGHSLVPLLKDPKAKWDHVSITYLSERGSYGLSDNDWRMIQYANGENELYNIKNDPYEWNNLAEKKEHSERLAELKKLGPQQFAVKPKPTAESLTKLKWNKLSGKNGPGSKPDGGTFQAHFINKRENPVELFWMDPKGLPVSYGRIKPGKTNSQSTRPGAVWQINDGEGSQLGYFSIGDRSARGVIPKK